MRDAVALTVSAAAVLTLGDEATVDLSVHNVDGAAGTIRLPFRSCRSMHPRAGAEHPVASAGLKTGERNSERLALKPKDVGLQTYDVAVTGRTESMFAAACRSM